MTMSKYTFRRHTAHTKTLAGWIYKLTDQFEILSPDGTLADWPLLDSEDEAAKDCREFNSLDNDEAASEALWQARMAGLRDLNVMG